MLLQGQVKERIDRIHVLLPGHRGHCHAFKFRIARTIGQQTADLTTVASHSTESAAQPGPPHPGQELIRGAHLIGGGAEIIPGVEHRQHKSLSNRVDNSHQPARRRERIMKRFKSPRQAQRFLSTHDQIANFFSRRRNQDTAAKFYIARSQAFATWAEVTGVAMAA